MSLYSQTIACLGLANSVHIRKRQHYFSFRWAVILSQNITELATTLACLIAMMLQNSWYSHKATCTKLQICDRNERSLLDSWMLNSTPKLHCCIFSIQQLHSWERNKKKGVDSQLIPNSTPQHLLYFMLSNCRTINYKQHSEARLCR